MRFCICAVVYGKRRKPYRAKFAYRIKRLRLRAHIVPQPQCGSLWNKNRIPVSVELFKLGGIIRNVDVGRYKIYIFSRRLPNVQHSAVRPAARILPRLGVLRENNPRVYEHWNVVRGLTCRREGIDKTRVVPRHKHLVREHIFLSENLRPASGLSLAVFNPSSQYFFRHRCAFNAGYQLFRNFSRK